MIEEISIRDLGVIAEARLPLGPGFTALTGETGAGKTMVVTALGLLLGERADSGVIRSGAAQSVVEGHWEVADSGPVAERVRDAGGELDGAAGGLAALVLGRSVTTDGRSRAVVGGRAAPVGVLSEIGQHLVVVHGQSDQIRLRSATAQREALDRYAGPEFAVLLGDYQEVFRRWQTQQGELDVLVTERDRRAREADELRQAMAEIEAAAPQRGEDAELAEKAERLTNLEDLRLAATEAQEAISSQTLGDAVDAVGLIETARRAIERVAGHDPALVPIADSLAAASFAASEAS
ncbi:MAG: AAA family ATPase, partial [Pseudolysinimonas sp.]